jgi:hypothetical protein
VLGGRWGRRTVQCVLAGAACVVLSGMPAQATGVTISINFGNWYQGHTTWAAHCFSQPQQGHWGRNPQYDTWCHTYLRFSSVQPDAPWRHDHPWDHGRPNDYDNQGPQAPAQRTPDDGNSK